MPEPRVRVGRDEAGALLDALDDPSPQTRLALLDALTRLPLDQDCWLAVRRYVAWAIQDRSAPEHLEAIDLAGRVPVASVRAALRRLAEEGEPDERRRAIFALGAARAEGAVELLLGLVGGADPDVEAARLLARNDVRRHLDAVREVCGRLTGDPRFWVALALARAGEDRELFDVLESPHAFSIELPFLDGDPEVAVAELRPGPPLPEATLARLRTAAAAESTGLLANLLVEASEPEPEPATKPADHPAHAEPLAIPAALRAGIRATLAGFAPSRGWDSRVDAAIAAAASESGAATATALAVSELFRAMALDPGGYLLGNELVGLVRDTEGFVPDLEGLLEAVSASGGVGAQLAWTAARGGLELLLAGLAPHFERPEQRLAAARLVAAAAGYVDEPSPVVGGGTVAPEPPTNPETIDDLASANGGDGRRTRGLPEASDARAPEAEPRWILARVTDLDRPEAPLERAFRAGGAHEIAVAIGPEQAGMLAATGAEPFDRALGPTPVAEPLFVAFIVPPLVGPNQTSSLFLPPTGTSRPCTFAVQVPADLTSFEAEIRVYHRNRIVQLAFLRGPVVPDPSLAPAGSKIELELTVLCPGTADLDTRQPFDAGLARTSAATTAVADEALVLFDNDRIDDVVPKLARILGGIATSDAARRRDLEDPGVVDDLRALAFQGRELHGAIAEPLAEQLGERPLDRLQVLVESATDFFPVEFVYELPRPASDAGLCPGWREGLRTGTCPAEHGPTRGFAEHVCPTGFWALSKVIERQVVGRESWRELGLVGTEFAVRAHPTAERRTLDPPRVALFAASSRVDGARKGGIQSVRNALERIADEAVYVETWDAWIQAVLGRDPTLLVLLSHSTEDQFQAALEVGDRDLCLLAQVEEDFVRASPERRPIVLLLGCETAVVDVGLQTFVGRFQDLGAAIVVGTIASVFGQRAAPVARTLAEGLAAAARRPRPSPVGDLLLRLRRRLLASGELTALCLTAFGDADWQLGGV